MATILDFTRNEVIPKDLWEFLHSVTEENSIKKPLLTVLSTTYFGICAL